MIRPFVTSILSIMILWSMSYQSLIVINFYVNQGYIADVYCVNKDKPKMECHGQCHLKKQLKKTEQSEPFKILTSSLEQKFISQEYHKTLVVLHNHTYQTKRQTHYRYIQPMYAVYLPIVLPPPQAHYLA